MVLPARGEGRQPPNSVNGPVPLTLYVHWQAHSLLKERQDDQRSTICDPGGQLTAWTECLFSNPRTSELPAVPRHSTSSCSAVAARI